MAVSMCVGILYRNLKKSITNLSLGRRYIFERNNDTKHPPKIVKDYCSKNKIKILEWPPQNPNLNLIKNLRSILHQKLPFEERKSKNHFFLERIKDEWHNQPGGSEETGWQLQSKTQSSDFGQRRSR
ncbi:hypothetical protein AVEN_144498-1 [Araneus ventricosus]|uniref:Tc1-like transposase DDE domain-containing protein n=1 Tax=Araneus ventricosus TaxID=182803 RepID=A0A4Y2SZA7_ARAVE|nr:hypothetical protein AVEN_144498-1 [Araneus ventricosus]